MIVTKISGGLGNQLFQYAVGRALALRNKVPLFFDIDAYTQAANFRAYSLGGFKITQNYFEAPSRWRKAWSLVFRNNKFYPLQPYMNYDLVFDPQVLNLPDDSYLIGYWQSEQYFRHIRRELLQDLVLTTPLGASSAQRLMEIKNANAVCLHVRRGDYVSNPDAAKIYYRCDQDYYQRAFEYLASQLSDLVFFVFSDDIVWAKEHLKFINNAIFVDDPGRSHYDDFELMRACKHFITANSTYSWWAAWLSDSPGKMVVTPAQWFLVDQDPKTGFKLSVQDLIPETWIKI